MNDKKKADQIYSKLLHYALYGTMVVTLGVIVFTSTQQDTHDTRSRASKPVVSPMQLTEENQPFDNHCYTVNDIHTRTWSGKLTAHDSFTIDLPFCTNNSIENLAFAATTDRSTAYSLSAVSPSGRIVYPPSTQENHKTVCVIPTKEEIEKGSWQIILTAYEDELEDSDITVIVAPKNSQEIEMCAQ